jgi:5-methylcytosine-specific restriction endonuclease McrA
MFRLASDDERKSPATIKRQLKYKLVCCIDGCGNPISQMTGPGSDRLCRDHQVNQIEYGRVGRMDRPHTFHRKWVCDHCGKDVSEEVRKKFPDLEASDPVTFNRLCRNRIIGDHIIRQADGGDNSKENLQSLCLDCNSDKTILNEDYKRSSL